MILAAKVDYLPYYNKNTSRFIIKKSDFRHPTSACFTKPNEPGYVGIQLHGIQANCNKVIPTYLYLASCENEGKQLGR